MDPKKKAKATRTAAAMISNALDILDHVEDGQSSDDRDLTNIYYELYDKQSELELIADAFETAHLPG